MSRHIIVYLVLLLILPFMLLAQEPGCSFTLSGKVIDEHDDTALSFATIVVKETNQSAIGDSAGFYTITGICAGDYTVVCHHIGCEPVELKVKIRGNTVQNFYPEHHAEELKDVLVFQHRSEHTTSAAEAVNAKTLEENAGKTFSEMAGEITGVSLLQTGPTIAKPVIHGLHGNRILIIQNGIRQEDQQWGAEHAPELDPFAASKITVIKGAGVVRYGSDAIGGIILSEPESLPQEAKLSGAVSAVGSTNGWMGALSAHLQGGAKRWKGFGWRVQGSAKRKGDMQAPDYNLSNTGARETGATAALGLKREKYQAELYYSYFSNELAILRASHTGNLTDLQNAINSARPWYIENFTFEIQNPKQQVAHHLVKAKTLFFLKKNWKFEVKYGYQFNNRREYDIRRGGRSSIPAIDLHLQTHTLDAVVEKFGKKNFQTTLGIAGLYQDNYNVPGTGIRPLIPDYLMSGAGLFFIERFDKNDWEAELGARYDLKTLEVQQFSGNDVLETKRFAFHNFSGTAGGVWRKKYFSVRTNFGVSFRPPSVNELFSQGLHHGAAAIEEGDESLRTEKGFKWISSIEYRRSPAVEMLLSGYLNRIADYIYLKPEDELRLTIRGAFPVFRYVQTNARLAGLDFSAKVKTVANLFLQSKFSYIRARDLVVGTDLFGIPSNRFENALSYERERWGKLADVKFSVGVLNVLEQKKVPAGVDFAPPPDAYFLLNASVGFRLPLRKERKLGLQVEADNLLNTTYRDYMNRFRYYADDTGRNFTLRIHYSF